MSNIGYHTGFVVDNITDGRSAGLNDCITDHGGVEWVYVQAGGAISQYDFVTIDETGQAVALALAGVQAGHKVGVAQVAFTDNDYGWIATKGMGLDGNVDASTAADVTLHVSPDTSLPGQLGDRTSTSARIEGIVAIEAQAGTSVAANVTLLISTQMHAPAGDY